MLAIAVWFCVGLSVRSPLKFDVIRDRGALARTVGRGDVENVYRLQVMHALEHAQHYSIRVSGPQGLQLSADSPDSVMLEPVGERLVPLAVHLPAEQAVALAGQNVPIAFHIQPEDSQEDAHAITEVSRFIVPK